jgi:hypothetical protein
MMVRKIKIYLIILIICTSVYDASFDFMPVSLSKLASTSVTTTSAEVSTTDITSREQLKKLFLNAYINGNKEISFKIDKKLADKINSKQLIVDVWNNENAGFKYFTTCSILIKNNYKCTVTFESSLSQECIAEMNKKVLAKVKQIVKSTIKPNMTDYQKELALHEYLLNNIKYDYTNYNKGKIPDLDYTPYGALIRKVAVCQGYSEAMILLLKEVKIQSIVVSGTAKGVNHAWNMVKIEGQWYQLDATFNHAFVNRIQKINHSYFNVTDAQIAKNHSWDRKKYPKCTNTKFAYKGNIY